MKYLITFFIFCSFSIDAALQDHFKPAVDKSPTCRMKNVDFIYMINLDRRPEKFLQSSRELIEWGIIPYRFSAVNGWELSLQTVADIGVHFTPKMSSKIMATYYEAEHWKDPTHEHMTKPGRTYFCHCMSLGAIGIALSHLSILQDAYDSGYQTIWVMEDDIEVLRDPRLISDLIEHLDEKIGKGWDILFTDRDTKDNNGNYVPCSGYAKRPNFKPVDKRRFAMNERVCSHFRKIGARFGAYSMIVRRSGMEKILSFLKKYGLFLPYDMDFCMPENINLFTVLEDVVSTHPNSPSDNGGANYVRISGPPQDNPNAN